MKIAIVGCGQLARMLALAGIALGHKFSFIAEAAESTQCVDGLGNIVHLNCDLNVDELYQQLGCPDVVTVEKEQVSLNLLRALQKFCEVYPNPDAIHTTQNRIREKKFLHHNGLPLAPFVEIHKQSDLELAAQKLRFPLFLKHADLGYDGKNQWRIDDKQALQRFAENYQGAPLVAEQGVDFLFEASLIGVRNNKGNSEIYAATKNQHRDGILLWSLASESWSFAEHLIPARQYLEMLLHEWRYVGVLAMELFVTDNGVLINELAPRVHNSGHWTLDAPLTSQFENHIRAITGEALGHTKLQGCAGMLNLLGVNNVPIELGENSYLWQYPKSLKPGRKMGHINITAPNEIKAINQLNMLTDLIYGRGVSNSSELYSHYA
ncbi:5-(carboxyamino)imidazole ribonucleotide synthase [Alteromonadaceae bacterium 2753L.S.0a.02]|nr:5-(carboxyamino)imidazole ribonucleotide synthase [Alteromonadaceae bacterium 2753L.S.0a.02]